MKLKTDYGLRLVAHVTKLVKDSPGRFVSCLIVNRQITAGRRRVPLGYRKSEKFRAPSWYYILSWAGPVRTAIGCIGREKRSLKI
ncbi:MAG TPA: hypothetical protein VFV82_05420, partial [Candidatus Binatia bacterium]|nr:hypothetical protein [Candidatus Binatia bacterium]